jgi:hypothetical protein
MTDVTGFGLLGHLLEMCRGAGLAAEIDYDAIRLPADLGHYVAAGAVAKGLKNNWRSYGHDVTPLHEPVRSILCDPQTGGGLLNNLRLAQVTAVVAPSTLRSRRTTSIAVHEPNLLGLVSGADAIYAETGANPRDLAQDTSGSRGIDVPAAKRMLHEAGFTQLRRGDGTHLPLRIEAA